MALEGTLDTVSLPEVLRLLAGGKSGRLVVDGERPGVLDVRHGRVVAVETARTGRLDDGGAGPLAEGVFELLRSDGGTFRFDPAGPVADGAEEALGVGSPLAAVEALVDEATDLLASWREVEVVVPSLRVAVEVAEAPPGGEAVLDAERWPVLVAAARSATVAEVGERLGLDEVRASYAVRDLVGAGLAAIGPEVVQPEIVVEDVGWVEPEPEPAVEPAVPAAGDPGWAEPAPEAVEQVWAEPEPTQAWVEAEPPAPVEPAVPVEPADWQTTTEVPVVVDEPAPTMAMDAVPDAAVPAAEAPPLAEVPAPAGGDWADEEVLDQVFSEWVPGPPAEAHPLEREMLVVDRERQAQEDAGILERLLGTLRN